MSESTAEHQRRRRARIVLGGIVAGVVVVLAVAAVIAARVITAPQQQSAGEGERQAGQQRPAPPTQQSEGGWNVAAQNKLARQQMVQFPLQAATPHGMTTRTAGTPIDIPEPQKVQGRWIPTGFPATPQGALAQLTALHEAGLAGGGDPAVYARAYRQLSLPGAPRPQDTGLHDLLTSMRPAEAPPRGPIPGWSVRYEVTHGLVKGTTDDGRFAVVCVLGQFSTTVEGNNIELGAGDCQSMRYVDGVWRISPTKLPYWAPNTWPGTAEMVRAGYRELI